MGRGVLGWKPLTRRALVPKKKVHGDTLNVGVRRKGCRTQKEPSAELAGQEKGRGRFSILGGPKRFGPSQEGAHIESGGEGWGGGGGGENDVQGLPQMEKGEQERVQCRAVRET